MGLLGAQVLGCTDDAESGARPDVVIVDAGADIGADAGADTADVGSADAGPDAQDFVPLPGFGESCEGNLDCETGWCVDAPGGGGVCTQTCFEECPNNWNCKGVSNTGGDVIFLCVPEAVSACTPCESVGDCPGDDDRCVTIPEEGGHCLPACDENRPCPDGFVCTLGDEPGDTAEAVCRPETGSCICSQELIGQIQPCSVSNELGTCWGFHTCLGPGGYSTCDAAQPAEEVCDGQDNDCDGEVDEDTDSGPCEVTNEFGTCAGSWSCSEQGESVCSAATPGPEICDGLDNNCDGAIDEHEGDIDDDGVPDCSDEDIDGDGDPNETDCAPWNPDVFTGAPEQCNGLDDNCDDAVPLDEVDADQDGLFGCQGDCNDTDPTVYPGAPELCDGKDNNCDEALPEDEVDGDDDGSSPCEGDCDDESPLIGPDVDEACNGADDDCDGQTDEVGAAGCTAWFVDADDDGAGAGEALCLCGATETHTVMVGGDCDDGNETISPLVQESCNDIDDDCDGKTDEAGATGCKPYLFDGDQDGYGAIGDASCLCEDPGNTDALLPGDCDDENPDVHPGLPEVCDGLDTNCDEVIPADEIDADADGVMVCEGDCRDDEPLVYPGADEICDGFDSNCDTVLPPDEFDDDKDGWTICGGDCNDNFDKAHPDGIETCSNGDEDCDGETDEPDAEGCQWLYPDSDGDDFGATALGQCVCAPVDGLITPLGSDCDDDDPLEHPGTGAPCVDDSDCCQPTQSCHFGTCIDQPTPCGDDDDCWNDSYCHENQCIPFGLGPAALSKPNCDKLLLPGLFLPTLQCEWTGPPAGDAYPNHKNVLGTPLVADFDLDEDPETRKPQIVFVSYNGEDGGFPAASSNGIIRVLDGETCEQLFTVDGAEVVGASPLAVADLDLAADDRPELVAFREGGGLVAFKYTPGAGFGVHWVATSGGNTSTLAGDANRWNGPTVVELDGPGAPNPEVLMGSVVFGHDGVQRANNLGYVNYNQGIFDVVADVDLDGKKERVDGAAVYEWTGSGWQKEPYVQITRGVGHVAVADFGDYPIAGLPDGIAEVGVIREGQASIQLLSGQVVFGPYDLPSWPPGTAVGIGGPPTIGDFDGDGVPELAAAGRGAYSIFDTDCTATPLPLGCSLPGVLWFQWSQDYSSSVTGSSIYDFEADGLAEAVYSDECFTRIYDGATGDVLFSQWRSSCTWYENPVVADSDGDFKAELVVGSNTNCSITCPSLDPIFRGLTCEQDSDCPSADGWCSVGRCRCQSDADCGPPESSYVCADPLPNTAGSGKVCRASHGGAIPGIRVYRDVADGWVLARPIWSQHAYSPAQISDTGVVHPATTVPEHWQQPGMNHFRQNGQGAFDPELAPDMTIKKGLPLNCTEDGVLDVPVEVCNRGALPVAPGVTVGFFDGDPLTTGKVICLEATQTLLQPEACETIICPWEVPDELLHDVHVYGDFGGPKGQNKECLENNNRSVFKGLSCVNW